MTIHQLLDEIRPALTRPGADITLYSETEPDPSILPPVELDGETISFDKDDRTSLSWTIRVDRKAVLWVTTGFDYQIVSLRPVDSGAEVAIQADRQFADLMHREAPVSS